jgi:iron complex transport system substrate-binding protein
MPQPSATAAASEAAEYPVTLTDDEGTEVTLAQEPERVISLSPANTEILFTLGVGDKVVGGTDFDDFPPEAAALPDVATFTGVLIEQVVDLEPDLVIAAGNAFTPADDIERMRQLGFTVMVVYAEDVPAVLEDIELIGRAVGAADEAADLTEQMQQRIDAVTAAVAQVEERPRVFYQIGSEPEIYGPAPDSFVADMIGLAGGEAITTGDPTAFSISVERLVKADPEVIIVGDAAYGVCPAQVKARPAWRKMTAVREDAVRPIDDLIVTRPGPRLPEGLAALAVAIHPGLELTPPPPPVPYCQ